MVVGSEARREIRLPNTRLVAAVGFSPGKYGESLFLLALESALAESLRLTQIPVRGLIGLYSRGFSPYVFPNDQGL